MPDNVVKQGSSLDGLQARVLSPRKSKADSAVPVSQQPMSPAPAQVHFGIPVPELVTIPAGEFIMGGDKNDIEKPQHTETLAEYAIGKYPVTNREFAAFVEDAGYSTEADQPGHPGGFVDVGKEWKRVKGADWRHPEGPGSSIEKRMNHPVVHVTWRDALAYCQWLATRTGQPFRPPTEAEWEKAARGVDKREHPWGNEFDAKKCNTKENKFGTITPVDAYSQAGDSPYGCADMVGNVWEWCSTKWRSNYTEKADDRLDGNDPRVLRGGSFRQGQGDARCASRNYDPPGSVNINIGFRVVVSPGPVVR